ncbi:hypothetical protein FD13_GL001161 [Levilactobacillus senmaizukei DSM 21775 = NBRC 103853]|uniref:Uncharacterized protein n=1 Tax=Levilactobacillus senmaizukei DSM 21775 = NBRC 103853 TaxID=1423803 RepID=A0A0R2DI27_9LACO|nr:type II toxin-antitoxin system PemK/MazF family toxin [Levilactobacillus senmaizukei]KRN01253.1 hypothetical protein FD13_GL001161 [Levilactobacillus senmaizukei DSM 21775 = NBRC 103853]
MPEKPENSKITKGDIMRQAIKNFKTVYYGNRWNKKFEFIPTWLLHESEMFLEEKKNYTHYKTFKRGAIVNVDFGVNIGDELSGPHFAIILNKNDSPSRGVLTVLPLTSHDHPNEVKLTDTIRNLSSDMFRDTGLGVTLALYATEIGADEFYLAANPKFPNAKQRLKTSLMSGEDKELGKSTFEIITHIIPNKNTAFRLLSNNGKRTTINLGRLLNPDGSHSDIVKDLVNTLIWTKRKYEDYNLVTYAKVADVTTISKQRLNRLSPFDPIGKIMVSNSTLTQIDQALAKLFIKQKSLVDNSSRMDNN